MKVVAPNVLVADAAEALAACWEEVVVVGAAGLQIVLADDLSSLSSDNQESSASTASLATHLDRVVVTPTQDVDVVTETEHARAVVASLEAAGLKRSEDPAEEGFTWVRGDLKIQLIRPFHPFPEGPARRLPANPTVSLLATEQHKMKVAFANTPGVPRLQCATPAALVALKEAAFGRSRANGDPVERDFHDVYLVVDQRPDDLERSYREATLDVRPRVDRALALLAEDGEENEAAARQHARITGDADVTKHQLAIRRSAIFFQRRVARPAGA